MACTGSPARTSRSILDPILGVRILNSLPLHVAWIVSATALQRLGVIDNVAGQGPGVLPVDGDGFARWNTLRRAESRLMRPWLSRSHVANFVREDRE